MNNHKFLILGLGLALFAASCKKQDLEAKQEDAVVTQTEWTNANNWTSSKEESYTSYSTIIQDKSITADVVENGLVLVYMRNGRTLSALPHQQKEGANAFWYYQVSENTITLSADVFTANMQPDNKQYFSYFIVSSEKIKALGEKGHTMSELMTLSFENAKSLLQ